MSEWVGTCTWCGVTLGRAAKQQRPLVWSYYNVINGQTTCHENKGLIDTGVDHYPDDPRPDRPRGRRGVARVLRLTLDGTLDA